MTLFIISFVAGLLTVLAPCILPLLPVIIGGSINGKDNRKRSVTVITSLIISLVIFTLLLKVSTLFVNIPQAFWTYFSSTIILFFGLTLLFPLIWEKLPFLNTLTRSSNSLLNSGFKKKSMIGDIIIGASLGPVFSTCSPTYFVILATVLPANFGKGLLYIFVYVLGLGIALFSIAFLGDKLVSKLGNISNPHGTFKRCLGALFILVAIFIASGYDKVLQRKILDAGFFDVTKIEQKLLDKNKKENPLSLSRDLSSSQPDENSNELTEGADQGNYLTKAQKAKKYPSYIEIADKAQFINSATAPSIQENIGKKVIMIDFMTYSCINCKRTFPYLNDWYSKYEKDGLLIIGIHTPEFAFEKKIENVRKALGNEGITFPIVLDNEYKTWNAWGNNSWPHKFLIDADGYVVYDHSGEGQYKETEEKIVELLNELKYKKNSGDTISVKDTIKIKSPDFFNQSRETYFGASRNYDFVDRSQGNCTSQKCFFENYNPKTVSYNKFSLSGDWKLEEEYVTLKGTEGSLAFRFKGKNVYLVANALNKNATVKVYIDGVFSGKEITISEAKMYQIVSESDGKEHTFELKVQGSGFEAFTFTFG